MAGIYEQRGLDPNLAKQVAEQLMSANALATHARDELGISDLLAAARAGCTYVGRQLRRRGSAAIGHRRRCFGFDARLAGGLHVHRFSEPARCCRSPCWGIARAAGHGYA